MSAILTKPTYNTFGNLSFSQFGIGKFPITTTMAPLQKMKVFNTSLSDISESQIDPESTIDDTLLLDESHVDETDVSFKDHSGAYKKTFEQIKKEKISPKRSDDNSPKEKEERKNLQKTPEKKQSQRILHSSELASQQIISPMETPSITPHSPSLSSHLDLTLTQPTLHSLHFDSTPIFSATPSTEPSLRTKTSPPFSFFTSQSNTPQHLLEHITPTVKLLPPPPPPPPHSLLNSFIFSGTSPFPHQSSFSSPERQIALSPQTPSTAQQSYSTPVSASSFTISSITPSPSSHITSEKSEKSNSPSLLTTNSKELTPQIDKSSEINESSTGTPASVSSLQLSEKHTTSSRRTKKSDSSFSPKKHSIKKSNLLLSDIEKYKKMLDDEKKESEKLRHNLNEALRELDELKEERKKQEDEEEDRRLELEAKIREEVEEMNEHQREEELRKKNEESFIQLSKERNEKAQLERRITSLREDNARLKKRADDSKIRIKQLEDELLSVKIAHHNELEETSRKAQAELIKQQNELSEQHKLELRQKQSQLEKSLFEVEHLKQQIDEEKRKQKIEEEQKKATESWMERTRRNSLTPSQQAEKKQLEIDLMEMRHSNEKFLIEIDSLKQKISKMTEEHSLEMKRQAAEIADSTRIAVEKELEEKQLEAQKKIHEDAHRSVEAFKKEMDEANAQHEVVIEQLKAGYEQRCNDEILKYKHKSEKMLYEFKKEAAKYKRLVQHNHAKQSMVLSMLSEDARASLVRQREQLIEQHKSSLREEKQQHQQQMQQIIADIREESEAERTKAVKDVSNRLKAMYKASIEQERQTIEKKSRQLLEQRIHEVDVAAKKREERLERQRLAQKDEHQSPSRKSSSIRKRREKK
ncbi:uncharacterized protein MONOS_4166 [Monocercomonoides exilis]|uniref:uncharacterized protein n=1 Tax=Monocercomonoides exilis TaxID=2049356 RepID=UPI003559AE77|nr:hypothetical protein MONOS_4166 [Monocercomonoides exilis]|eukprot:MONOS_4166.1-p1 / transcript=MONOS_4166.1 / gene=MONOS_4166 / organism=Monocercomonoides_exilis_PA203 / gene_product=unspecified product / transcript_product=unspecified product / location=Mono_scaffold00107:18956-22214(-) / protein_length=870 / sequence_SO=supercontig / SO=protein_coding / is_pseudo=false